MSVSLLWGYTSKGSTGSYSFVQGFPVTGLRLPPTDDKGKPISIVMSEVRILTNYSSGCSCCDIFFVLWCKKLVADFMELESRTNHIPHSQSQSHAPREADAKKRKKKKWTVAEGRQVNLYHIASSNRFSEQTPTFFSLDEKISFCDNKISVTARPPYLLLPCQY